MLGLPVNGACILSYSCTCRWPHVERIQTRVVRVGSSFIVPFKSKRIYENKMVGWLNPFWYHTAKMDVVEAWGCLGWRVGFETKCIGTDAIRIDCDWFAQHRKGTLTVLFSLTPLDGATIGVWIWRADFALLTGYCTVPALISTVLEY